MRISTDFSTTEQANGVVITPSNRNRTLLRGGVIVPVDPAYPPEFKGDLLIEESRIVGLAERIDVDESSTEVIDVTGAIVTPGLVDSHRHVWQSLLRYIGVNWTIPQYGPAVFGRYGPHYTPDDMYIALRIGLAEALDAGITQVFDWNHNLNTPDHTDAAVRAHRDSGARVVLGYGQASALWLRTYGESRLSLDTAPSEDIRRVQREYYGSPNQLTKLALAARGPEKASMEVAIAEWSQARDLAIPISVHVGNGIQGRERPLEKLQRAGLLSDDTTYVHCNALSDSEIGLIASTGGSVSCTPAVEANMGHGYPAVERLIAAGVRPSLSADTCVNGAGDLFGPMRATLVVVRAAEHARRFAVGEMAPNVKLEVADVLEFATLEGARANGLAARCGSLTPGKEADIVVFSCDAPNMYPMNYAAGAVVMGAHPGNVDTVFVAGRAVKRHGQLIGSDMSTLRTKAEHCRDELFARLMSDETLAAR